jgi:hypothetical protein
MGWRMGKGMAERRQWDDDGESNENGNGWHCIPHQRCVALSHYVGQCVEHLTLRPTSFGECDPLRELYVY